MYLIWYYFISIQTRIFVTNSLSFLPQFDQIVYLENGNVKETGNYDELVSKENGSFNSFMNTYLKNNDENIENISIY